MASHMRARSSATQSCHTQVRAVSIEPSDAAVRHSGVRDRLMNIYTQKATVAQMILESLDESV
jgi:hypothetical protein